jgi:4-hydroxy-tetrahydrodipicolinate synthase
MLMEDKFKEGVWPTMVTPFTDSNEIDYSGLERMIEWYLERGVQGLFAVCQSSEMFALALDERVNLARFIKTQVNGRVPVIASGHISDSIDEQIEEIKAISDTGIDAFVMVTNRLAGINDSDDVWKANAEKTLDKVNDATFGLYECPYPYKRLMSPELLKWCADTGKFLFLKDTSCDLNDMKEKASAVKGTGLKVFNANAATLLESLKFGISGFSGVMANFHPELYAWLIENWKSDYNRAKQLQNFLGMASLIERQVYPVNAKYFLQLEGLNILINSRTRNVSDFTASCRIEVEELYELSHEYNNDYRL